MASIGHVAVGMAAARVRDGFRRSPRALLGSFCFWAALSMLPDLDVIGMRRGIAYGAEWGHRGASHSLSLALALGAVVGVAQGSSAGRRCAPRCLRAP